MPWTTKLMQAMISDAKFAILASFQKYNLKLDTPVYICGADEMKKAVIEEAVELAFSRQAIQELEELYIPLTVGKYFSTKQEIWVLHGIGEDIDTIIHEFLHSVQQCSPNREGIVTYITYKITGNSAHILPGVLKEWQEIEKTNSYAMIQKRLLTEGDCEDF